MTPTLAPLRERLRAHGAAHRRHPYPPELRAEVLAFVAAQERGGASFSGACRALGLGPQTVAAWRAQRSFVPVSIPVTTAQSAPRELLVHGPAGLRIVGLDLDSLAALLRKLS